MASLRMATEGKVWADATASGHIDGPIHHEETAPAGSEAQWRAPLRTLLTAAGCDAWMAGHFSIAIAVIVLPAHSDGRRGCAGVDRNRRLCFSGRLCWTAAPRDRIPRVHGRYRVGASHKLRRTDRHTCLRRRSAGRQQSLRCQQGRPKHVVHRTARHTGPAGNGRDRGSQSGRSTRLESIRRRSQIDSQFVVNAVSGVLVGTHVNAQALRAAIAKEVGTAINGVGGAAMGITPANAARQAGAASADGRRSRVDVKI